MDGKTGDRTWDRQVRAQRKGGRNEGLREQRDAWKTETEQIYWNRCVEGKVEMNWERTGRDGTGRDGTGRDGTG